MDATGFVKMIMFMPHKDGRGGIISHVTKGQGSWFFCPMGFQDIIRYLFVDKL
jgi:hypothetical protein